MSIESLLNLIVSGTLTGLVFGLMALGLSVIFGVIRIINFAHGEMVVLAMYGAFFLIEQAGISPFWAMPVIAVAGFAAGYALQRGLLNRFVDSPPHIQFLLLTGLAMVLGNAMLMAFGPDARGLQMAFSFESYNVGPLVLDKARVIASSVAAVMSFLLYLFFRLSAPGKAIRACADNSIGAQVIGLDVKWYYAITFGVGASIIGVAGVLLLLINDVQPFLAPDFTLLGFIIVIVGGMGSLSGALVGGMIVGLTEALAGYFVDPSIKSLFSFGLLILILLFRPTGLIRGGR